MLLKLYEKNTNMQQIQQIVEVLRNGGVIVFPTDSVYAFGCDIYNNKAVERISRIKNKDLRKSNLSFACHELSQISEFAKMDNNSYKLIKKNFPGPFTFILNGSNKLPKLFKNKKTVGIRMPNNQIALEIIRELGNPMMTSSIFTNDDSQEYFTDPELIEEKFGDQVDLVIDGGFGGYSPSTIIDCTSGQAEITREGAGVLID